jgi:hypothetical protein
MGWFDNCTKVCLSGQIPCNCDFMPGQQVFLTSKDRDRHAEDYASGKTNWSAPFEPWVVETWRRCSEATGADKVAQKVRDRLTNRPVFAKRP